MDRSPQAESSAAVSVRNLKMGYGSRVLLESASFDVHPGEIVVILGGSGSGKSSLMKNLIGLYPPLAGDILIKGVSLIRAGAEEKAALQRKLGVMYQSGALFGSLTVLENIRFPLDRFTDLSLEEKNLAARMLLHTLEMRHAESLMPSELSGGMLKRVAIARAMALGCDILLLDEPSLGLSPKLVKDLRAVIMDVKKTFASAVLLVEQNAGLALTVAERGYLLHNGRIVASGPISELRDDRLMRDLYLGNTPQGH